MKYKFHIFLLLAALLFAGCEKKGPDAGEKNIPGYKELLAAYDAGQMYKEVLKSDGANTVVFDDGSKITVPLSSFDIHDHTSKPLPNIYVVVGTYYWSVDGLVLGIKAQSTSVPKEEAQPVYVYFDSTDLYMQLSNRVLLRFPSAAQAAEEELKRRQNIPALYINTGGKGIYDKENYVDGTITIKDPEMLYSDVKEFTAAMGIRGRGNSTWSFPKKPYKIKLKEMASIFGMGADKEWAILANYADRTLVRNILAMRLSEICGFSWTPHMYSVDVYLNNEYQGVYTLCEHKKVHKDRVDIDLDAGDVYLEIEQQQDETTCWWTGMGVPMMFSDPEEPSAELYNEITQWFEDFEAVLYDDANRADPEKGYAKYIDVDSFIDYYIVQELAKNTDGNLRKSSFITKKKGGKLEMYHLWDFDLTFGNTGWLSDPEGFYIKDYDSSCNPGHNWFNRMLKDPAFATRLKNRWNELYPQIKATSAFIDEQVKILDKAQQRNFEVWDINEVVDWVGVPSEGSYEAEVAFLKDFYDRRVEWLNKELNKL